MKKVKLSIALRLKKLREEKNLNQVEFASLIGTSQAAISHYERCEREPTADILAKIADKLNVNLNWLLTGEGSMFQELIPVDSSFLSDTIRLPIVAEIAAGEPVEVLSEEPLGFLEIPRSLLAYPPPYLTFRVSGNSMKPLILNGDLVICSRDWRNQHLSGKIMAFRTSDGITLKKLFLDPKTRTTWLIPLNDEYKPQLYTKDEEDLQMIGLLDLLIRPVNRE
ncbi:MAG: LexA family transcriptional regulator [Bacteroidales bacterium]|nr:LexA family transcriptional regulator [Bacteroidales bacterium]